MERMHTAAGHTVSWRTGGSGPPLLLVHGSFSDHESNWAGVWPMLTADFTVHALARRGRGETSPTSGHSVLDEAGDVAALLEAIGEPAFLLGHSYGAHCALGAALVVPGRVRKLVLYEAPDPAILSPQSLALLEDLAAKRDWHAMCLHFFGDVLQVPGPDLAAYSASPEWQAVLADAPATLGDLRAAARHGVPVEQLAGLEVETLLQVGTESPADLFLTAMLARHLKAARIDALEGQAHEGMTTAPEAYAAQVRTFLLG